MILFSKQLIDEIILYFQDCYPEEGVGFLAERLGDIYFYPVRNRLRSETQYQMEPQEQIDRIYQIEKEGGRLWGIVHSHPFGPATLSEADHALNFYPELYQMLVSLEEIDQPQLSLFVMADKHDIIIDYDTI